jgi:hypothetical protein
MRDLCLQRPQRRRDLSLPEGRREFNQRASMTAANLQTPHALVNGINGLTE